MLDTTFVGKLFSFVQDALGLAYFKPTIDTESKVQKAIAIRDQSLVSVEPPLRLVDVPSPLPLDVTHIPRSILTSEELRITSLDTRELIEEISSKRLSCVEVTRAFLRRAALAQHLVNMFSSSTQYYWR